MLGLEVGRIIAERLEAAGADVRAEARVRRLAADGVELEGGDVLRADAVLVAVGAEPAGDLVAAPAGVRTDACGRTSLPGVYACGDVASWHRPSLGHPLRVEHWTSAAGQAAAVASAILGEPRPYDEPPYFWSELAGLRLQHVGHAPPDAPVELEGGPDAFVARYLDAHGRLAAVLAANRPDAVAPARRELAEPRVPLAA